MLKKIVEKMLFYPKVVITIFLSLSVISIFLILNFLEVDTSTDALINKKLKFKIDKENLKKDFKILDNNILIRISGNKNEVNRVSKLIIEDLRIGMN